MNVIHINNSYRVWDTSEMKCLIIETCFYKYNKLNPEETLNRSYLSMYIEWYLHNIGYYITKPFINEKLKEINKRCKDVDLEEHKKK